MVNIESWDWVSEQKMLADIAKWKNQFKAVWEPYVSPDGEKIASIIKTGDEEFNVCVNEKPWEEPFDKLWYSRFGPDGRLTVLASRDMEWTLAVDGEPWEETYEYIWDTKFSADGKVITAAVKKDDLYSVSVNGKAWECSKELQSIASHGVSPDGTTVAAIAQTVPLGQADLEGFLNGTWSVVVNGKAWDTNFVDVYGLAISNDGVRVASEYRAAICEYGIAVNGVPWEEKFGCTWEPVFHPGMSNVVTAPVRQGGQWFLATNGKIIWDRGFPSILYQTYSSDGRSIAASVAKSFAKWTIAVDGKPWDITFGECVMRPYFSPDGRRVAAIAKDRGKWLLVVDGEVLGGTFDNIWPPVFTPDGRRVICKVEKNGRYCIAVDGEIRGSKYEFLWDPICSPDGVKVLIKGVENGKYYRIVAPLDRI